MNSSWLYQLDTLWIVVALLAAMALAGDAGFYVGRRWQPRTDEAGRRHIGLVLGSLLGLLALLLGNPLRSLVENVSIMKGTYETS